MKVKRGDLMHSILLRGVRRGIYVLPICVLSFTAQAQNPCDGYTTWEMKECAAIKIEAAEAELNARLQELSDRLPPEQHQAHMVAQDAWTVYRDRHCETTTLSGGSIAGVNFLYCSLDMINRRIEDLQDATSDPNGPG